MVPSTVRFTLIAGLAAGLCGCNHLGLCSEDHLKEVKSPTGHYQAEIVQRKCIGSAAVQKVLMRRTQGFLNGATAVAVFDAAEPERLSDLSVRWRGEHRIVITANDAKVWYFQPNWRDVRVMKR
ncbi:MAG: hypothetical protein QM647_06575 [Asticcacaulis sp.]|uniref:hypothetical protein n=1 Tax=Asticcacaulis sp. TaxID=1872648 RepID=UPI0039E6C157